MIYLLQFLNTADCRTPYIFLDLYFNFSESVYYTFHSFMSTYLKIVYFYTQDLEKFTRAEEGCVHIASCVHMQVCATLVA
eukprot:SAG11_NODE_36708_length_257_cov_0.776398_1_plen_79_part_01